MNVLTPQTRTAAATVPAAFSTGHPASSLANKVFIAMLILLALAPAAIYPVFLMKVLCMALFACSFNLLAGYGGLMSFGHAAYFGFGAYVTAWVAKNWGLSTELAILSGGVAAAAVGTVFGWIAIRRPGAFFPMVTLALGQMMYFFCLQAPFTNGEDGIQRVPRGTLFGIVSLESNISLYAVIATIFVLCFLLVHRIVHSPFGHVLKSTRDNEQRALSLGFYTNNYKLITFIIASAIAGIAGGCKSIVFGIATLADVGFAMSGEALLMTLIGGIGTIFGPILGALLITSAETFLAPFGAWVTVAQGMIFVVSVLAFRRGIVGEIARKLRREL